MKKFRLFIDTRNEEKWLNNMIQKGWLCEKVNAFGIYYFERSESLNQTIRLDFQSFKSNEMYQQYQQIHEDFGWCHIGGSRNSSTQYWLCSKDEFNKLYSDNASKKAFLKRLANYYAAFTFFFFILTIVLFDDGIQYTNLKSAYFTPGIWEMQGLSFLTAFLVETPFALLRFSSPWFILIFGIAFIFTYLKYDKKLKQID